MAAAKLEAQCNGPALAVQDARVPEAFKIKVLKLLVR